MSVKMFEQGPEINLEEEFAMKCDIHNHVPELLTSFKTKCLGLWMTDRKGGDKAQFLGIPMPWAPSPAVGPAPPPRL